MTATRTRASHRLRGAVALVMSAALLASCASGDDDDRARGDAAEYPTGLVNISEAGEPQQGGTLSFGAFAEPGVLDPAQTIVAGSTGGLEMAAIYDVLMRWNSAENVVEPQLAESLEHSDDFQTWTLKLRDGVRFSDGTTLDSAAVKFSVERYVRLGADEAMLWSNNVASVETPDPLTVVFNLETKWPSFDYMLTTGPGMIVAESAGEGDSFTPVGAGPFVFGAHRPRESIVLNANPDYWGGEPNLDSIRVVFLNDPSATFDSFKSGDINTAFLRDPDLVDEAVQAEYSGYVSAVSLGNVAVINGGEGRPGNDPRVRQAMHMAIDPQVVADRAYDGAGMPSNEIFPSVSTWHTDVEPLPYDPDRARELLEEAKADGYDGQLTWLDGSDPASRATALTAKAFLEAVGFEVELDLVPSVQDQIVKVAVDRNYDVAGWGVSWREAGPYGRMFATLHSQGNLSAGMPTSPEMDALFDEFQGAESEEEQREVMGRIQEQWNEQVPALILSPTFEFMLWDENVHGIVESTNSMVLLHEAWIG